MDISIDYFSPAIFASLVSAFAAFFILFRNYRFHLNALFGALGIFMSAWYFLLYLLSQNPDPLLLAYILVFSNLLLYFIFLLLNRLENLPTRTEKILPAGSFFFPRWLGLILGAEISLLGVAFLVFIFSSANLIDVPQEIANLANMSLYYLSLLFSFEASLAALVSFFRLYKNVNIPGTKKLEKSFAVIFGAAWLLFSLGCLAISTGYLSPIEVDSFSILLIIASLGVTIILAIIVNRRYFLSSKVLITQFIATLIVMFNLVSILNASNIEEIVLRVVLIVVLAFLSHLLVKSVVSEIQKRTKIQDTAQEIYAANKALTRLDRAKSDFIASASHQLRSPLSVVKGIASMLLDGSYGKISAQIKSALEKVYISNERLIGLIESLLDISHLEEGRVEFSFVKTDLNAIAKKSYEGLGLQAQNKKLYLKFQPYKKSKLLVWADESKITEAISNLIDNALKYTRKGGVTVGLKKVGNTARVTVRDTGIGLKKDEIGNLFQKFVRAGRGNKMSIVGTGLGLYVVRKMVEAHKGKIYAESSGEGRGSSFIIELPLNLKTPPDEKFIKRMVMEKQPA